MAACAKLKGPCLNWQEYQRNHQILQFHFSLIWLYWLSWLVASRDLSQTLEYLLILKCDNFVKNSQNPNANPGNPVVKSTTPRVVDDINPLKGMVQKHNKTYVYPSELHGQVFFQYLQCTPRHDCQVCGQRSRRWVARLVWWELLGMRLAQKIGVFLGSVSKCEIMWVYMFTTVWFI